MKLDPSSDLARDLAAAESELRTRRDQTLADLDDRQRQLRAISDQLAGGTLDLRAAQARIRQLVADRGGIAGAAARAGRTTITMTVPAARSGAAPVKPGSGAASTESAVARVATTVAERLVNVALRGCAPGDRGEARVELSLLTHLRRALDRAAGPAPDDPVLAAAVNELCDGAQATLAALEAGGLARIRALAGHVRVLVSQLAALGGASQAAREQTQRVKSLLAATDLAAATHELVAAFDRVVAELERRHPAAEPGLIDDLFRT